MDKSSGGSLIRIPSTLIYMKKEDCKSATLCQSIDSRTIYSLDSIAHQIPTISLPLTLSVMLDYVVYTRNYSQKS